MPKAPAKINEMATIKKLELLFFTLSQSQYPIPPTATILKMVSINLPYSPGIFAPQAIPSFSIKNMCNQLNTGTLSPN